ncbi:MAG: radical SAM protein, partial [Desulfobacterales bacterium]|nr:radical SAM protein [Desulfobacterales bacterium]
AVDIPVSLLIAPTVLKRQDLLDFKYAGADMIGVAIDLATPELFDRYRGKGVNGPHEWDRYWQCLADAVDIFGEWNAGSHFMVGMGETEKEMVQAIQAVRDMGGRTHLFSFFPEQDSALAHMEPPPLDQYRRIQLARHLIDHRISTAATFSYSPDGRILDFSLDQTILNDLIDSGEPFRTSGCEGYDGDVACNRPYANSRPGPNMRNYPFSPTPEDVQRIRRQMRM